MSWSTKEIAALVEPDRIHRSAYVDEEVFRLEIANIFEKTWIYVGHESQVPNPGDYYVAQIGRQPMMMVRGKDGGIRVLYNRCPHRGAMMCSARNGNTGDAFRCSYHAWMFNLDGSIESIPAVGGYDGTRFDPKDPAFHIKPAARAASYRGFWFASLAADGPDLETHLGGAKLAFDQVVDRAPDGEVEVVGDCFRIIQKSNWKIFLENQLDASHPSATHESTGYAAWTVEQDIERKTGHKPPMSYHFLSAFKMPIEDWNNFETIGHRHGHCSLQGYMALRPQDPDSMEYERLMREAYGPERAEEILATDLHHVLVYPCLSVQPPLQQLRAVRPLAPDRTLTEIWHFRLKGAPEPIYRRALDYYYLVNSPSTMVNADDLHNFWKCQQGLTTDGGDWVSFHRNAGQDHIEGDRVRSVVGMSEAPMRNMFRAWTEYMTNGS